MYHRISYSCSCRVAVFSGAKRISSDPQRFAERARVVSQCSEGASQVRPFRSLSNRPFRLPDGLLDIHALSPWSWRALPAETCVSSSISVNVEYNDRWCCRNRQATPIMFMSGVLQLCRSFGLSRFRLQRIAAQNTVLVGSVGVLVQDRETAFTAPGELLAICCHFFAEGGTRGARLRDEIPEPFVDAQASNTRTGVGGCAQGSRRPFRGLEFWSMVFDPPAGQRTCACRNHVYVCSGVEKLRHEEINVAYARGIVFFTESCDACQEELDPIRHDPQSDHCRRILRDGRQLACRPQKNSRLDQGAM